MTLPQVFLSKFKLLCVLALLPRVVDAQTVSKVDAVGMTVSDMKRSVDFYTKVLRFEIVSDYEHSGDDVDVLRGLFGQRFRSVRMKLGREHIILTDYLTVGGRSIPADSRSNDLWFQHIAIVVSDMDAAYKILREANVPHVSVSPQTLPKSIPAAEGIKAFYFQDPDGHNLEVIYFPPGKGDPRWQGSHQDIFLGIDHTAIGIGSTASSAKFYQSLLGMRFAGESLNYGREQSRLNHVENAVIHITGNTTGSSPGVEFLDYVEPDDGRAYPHDARVDDLISWEIIYTTSDIAGLYKKLKESGVRLISNGIVELGSQFPYRKGFYVRDPDGHLIGIFQQ